MKKKQGGILGEDLKRREGEEVEKIEEKRLGKVRWGEKGRRSYCEESEVEKEKS